MTRETVDRVLKAMERDYGMASDNAHRARAAAQRAHTPAEAALYREYEREETDARNALSEVKAALR